jgi:hypothetical protein
LFGLPGARLAVDQCPRRGILAGSQSGGCADLHTRGPDSGDGRVPTKAAGRSLLGRAKTTKERVTLNVSMMRIRSRDRDVARQPTAWIIDRREPTGADCSLLYSSRVKKQPACVMHTELGISERADARTDDERWAAWVAKGAKQDKQGKKRAITAVAVVAVGLGLWFANVLLLG